MRKVNVLSKRSPGMIHIRFLAALEKQASLVYRHVTRAIIDDLMSQLKKDRLIKSENDDLMSQLKKDRLIKSENDSFKDKLGPGWTGEVSKIQVNLSSVLNKSISKHLLAMRWIMLGDYAGKEAKAAAKKLGLVGKVTPGLMQAAYLSSLDMHMQHFQDVTGKMSEQIPNNVVKGSMEQIVARTNRYLDQVNIQLQNSFLNSVQRLQETLNIQNVSKVHREAAKTPESELSEVLEDTVLNVVPTRTARKELVQTAKNFEKNWDTAVKGELGLSSAAGTHQAVMEIYQGNDEDVRVAWIESEDERVCSFCRSASQHPDGSYKLYRLSDLKPSGYNIGKKRKDWGLAIPPGVHPHCRCFLVYVPKGFKVLPGGELAPDR